MKRLRFTVFALVTWMSFGAFALQAQAICTKDSECGLGQICQIQFGTSGACVNPPSCTADADCSGGKTCQFTSATTKACLAPPTPSAPGTSAPAGAEPVELKNPLGAQTVPELARNIISQAVGIVGALALLMFIYGGLRWLTSAGEPAKIQAGKDAMKWAAIGLVVIFTSYALVTFVFKALTG